MCYNFPRKDGFMKLKDKLKTIRNSWFESVPTNRDYEFKAEFDNHKIGDANVYRLHYINYHRFGENYGMGPNNLTSVDFSYQPFMLPRGMSREDTFKILSYLTDYIERELEIDACSNKSVAELDKALNLEELGFTRLNIHVGDDTDIIELFTVTGRIYLFKNSKYYSKYFEWYTEGITLDEVEDIYKKCGMVFRNIDLEEREEVKKRCLDA